jgi:putative nucleotidyltransferase with HDIG domain
MTGMLAAERHSCRVALWASALATELGAPPHTARLVEEAARLHHGPGSAWSPPGFDRLLADLGVVSAPLRLGAAWTDSSETLHASLLEVCGRRMGRLGFPLSTLSRVLEFAHAVDEAFDASPYEDWNHEEATQWVESLRADSEWRTLSRKWRRLKRITEQAVFRAAEHLPVRPEIARQVLRLAMGDHLEFARLAQIVSGDPALAAALLRSANSAAFSPCSPIFEIRQAIAFIGLSAARRVITAAAWRPLFDSPRLRALWNHSLEAASLANILAPKAGLAGEEAFLAGLLHDIGRIMWTRLPREMANPMFTWIEAGCDTVSAETVLAGFDHGEAGAVVLDRWSFPQLLCEAVARHHRPGPGASPLACLLYLCEELSLAGEDRASRVRLGAASGALGIDLRDLQDLRADPSLECLRMAA